MIIHCLMPCWNRHVLPNSKQAHMIEDSHFMEKTTWIHRLEYALFEHYKILKIWPYITHWEESVSLNLFSGYLTRSKFCQQKPQVCHSVSFVLYARIINICVIKIFVREQRYACFFENYSLTNKAKRPRVPVVDDSKPILRTVFLNETDF